MWILSQIRRPYKIDAYAFEYALRAVLPQRQNNNNMNEVAHRAERSI